MPANQALFRFTEQHWLTGLEKRTADEIEAQEYKLLHSSDVRWQSLSRTSQGPPFLKALLCSVRKLSCFMLGETALMGRNMSIDLKRPLARFVLVPAALTAILRQRRRHHHQAHHPVLVHLVQIALWNAAWCKRRATKACLSLAGTAGGLKTMARKGWSLCLGLAGWSHVARAETQRLTQQA